MKWFATARPGLAPVINHMRGRDPSLTTAIRLDRMTQADNAASTDRRHSPSDWPPGGDCRGGGRTCRGNSGDEQ
jgi:hypothetical protein